MKEINFIVKLDLEIKCRTTSQLSVTLGMIQEEVSKLKLQLIKNKSNNETSLLSFGWIRLKFLKNWNQLDQEEKTSLTEF